MPGFLTHYIAGQAVLGGVAPKIHKKIKNGERLYNLGAQGPDIFFYYLPGIIRRRSRNLGGQMHKNDLGIFIARLAYLAKKIKIVERDLLDTHCKKYASRDFLFAYTAGLAMHYLVDVHAHPYVYANVYNEGVPDIKNSADHRVFETAIDVELLKLVRGKRPADYSQWELIHADADQCAVAARAISNALKQVYDRNVPAQEVYQAMRYMSFATRILRSNRGRRKKWTAVAENFIVGEPIFSSLVHPQQVDNDTDYLNRNHTPWSAPWETESHTDSFLDLYNAAVQEGLQLVDALYGYVYEDLSLRSLAAKIGNRSLQTGAPCHLNLW